MIDAATRALQQGGLDQNNAVVPFARQVDLRIAPTRPSAGKFLMIGRPDLF